MKTRRDLGIAAASQIAYKALGFAVLAMLARQLSTEDYGKLMFSLSLCLVTATITDLGSSQELLRRVAARPTGARRRAGVVLGARIALIGLYLVLVNTWVALTKRDVLPIVAAISLYAAAREIYHSYSALALGLRRIGDTVAAFGAKLVTLTGGIAIGVALNQSLRWMVGCYLASAAVLVLVSRALARRRVGPIPIRIRVRRLSRIFGRSLVLFALTIAMQAHFGLGTILLGYLAPYAEVARYEVAAKLLEATQSIVRPMSLIFLPVCAELASRARWEELRKMFGRMFAVTALIGVVAVAAIVLLAAAIIPIVYTSRYDGSVQVLRVLALAVPGLLLAGVGCLAATAMHRERDALAVMAAGVVANVVLGLWAIPRFGAIGTARVMVITQTFVGIGLAFQAFRALAARERTGVAGLPGIETPLEAFDD